MVKYKDSSYFNEAVKEINNLIEQPGIIFSQLYISGSTNKETLKLLNSTNYFLLEILHKLESIENKIIFIEKHLVQDKDKQLIPYEDPNRKIDQLLENIRNINRAKKINILKENLYG